MSQTSAVDDAVRRRLDELRAGTAPRRFSPAEARISAPTLVEARIVVGSYLGAPGRRRLESLLTQADVEVVPFDPIHAAAAAAAYQDFGKGAGHPARLNLADVFSYALASVEDEHLLYVGDDFSRTDIRSALEEFGD